MATKSEMSWHGSFPLRFSDGGDITLTIHRYATNVFHTIWCYPLSDTTGPSASWPEDKRKLLTYEDGIKWLSSDPLLGSYTITLPESVESLFDFTSNPDNNTVNKIGIKLITYSNNSYSGNSIIGSSQIFDTTFTVEPSEKMYPQVTLSISDATNAYNASGGQYFYIGEDAAHSSNGYIKFNVRYWEGHEEGKSESFSINNQDITSQITADGFAYTINNIKDDQNKTTFSYTIIDGRGLKTQIANSDPIIKYWTDHASLMTQFNNLKENREDEERYDYKEGKTPVPVSLYLAPDWLPNQYTTAAPPNDWEYFADIGDDTTGLINQRNILNDKKRELNLQLYRKYYKYIQEGTWLDDQYIDDDLYYLDANKILNQSSYPKATYTIDVVDIEGIPKYAAYTFQLGQRTYVEDPDMFGYTYLTVAGNEHVKTPFRKEVIISERSRNLDDPSKSTIKVQTYKNQWEDIFSSLTATTQSLQYASGGYNRAANAVNPNGSINVHSLEQTFQQGDFALSGSATQSITWDGSYGIEITDLSNSLIKLRIASNGLAITTDGGTTWNNAITGNGINTNYLLAGQIDASKINIISKEGDYAFNWNEKGLNAILPLQEGDDPDDAGNSYVRFNDLGIYGTIEGADIDSWESSNEDASIAERIAYIKEHSTFFLGWEGLTLREIDGNVINLNPNVGLEIFNNDQPLSTNPWKWTNEKIAGTAFNKKYNGSLYADGEAIPVLTIGEFYYDNASHYGLLTRNIEGKPTLYTNDSGDLNLTGNLKIFSNGDVTSSNYILLDGPNGNIKHSNNSWYINASGYAHFGNADITGEINATSGNFSGAVTVGNNGQVGDQYIIIDGINDRIKSSNYTSGSQGWAILADGSAEFNNIVARGEINAGSGNFYGMVTVGEDSTQPSKPYIIIDGSNALIRSSNYQDGAGYGWMIDSDGDAIFNNITARGAIKTAVFEYAEIQAVGGIFLFRPSSTIKEAATQFVLTADTTVNSTKTYYTRSGNNYTPVQNPSGNPHNRAYYEGNLVLKVEKPLLFAKITYNKVDTPSGNPRSQGWYEKTSYGYAETTDTSVVSGKDYYTKSETDTGSWCKVSNYITDGASADSRVQNILLTNGLNYVYQIINVNTTTSEVTLSGAAEMVSGQNPVTTLEELKGGALVDMGRTDGSTNYGIGVNSSDNTVNLPARAISLFETDIDQTSNPKVSYNYRGILGTLPQLPTTQVNDNIYNVNMAGTQGIYTDNMYIGDASRFVAFYTEGNQKKLRIKANEIIFEGVNGTDVNASDSMIEVVITSSNGTVFKNHQGSTTLTCTVLQGNNDITNSVNDFAWAKNGESVGTNSRTLAVSDISSTAVYTCDVTLS